MYQYELPKAHCRVRITCRRVFVFAQGDEAQILTPSAKLTDGVNAGFALKTPDHWVSVPLRSALHNSHCVPKSLQPPISNGLHVLLFSAALEGGVRSVREVATCNA